MNKVLIIVAHADDEAIGMGGTIAKHTHNGDEVRLITLTDGVSSRDESGFCKSDSEEIKKRKNSLKECMRILGIKQHYGFNFPDNQMDSVALLDIVKEIEPVLFDYQPNIVYTHFYQDLNIDHQLAHRATLTACRPLPKSSVKTILAFPVRSSSEWQSASYPQITPNYFVDISDFEELKHQALVAYQQELREFPHSRSIKAIQAQQVECGARIGVEAAEMFYLERFIKN